MSKPNTSLSEMFENERAATERETLFQDDRDFTFLTSLSVEQANRIGGTVHLLPVSTERDPKGKLQSAGVDPLDGDILDPDFMDFSPDKDQRALDLHCIIEHELPKQLLKKYGIDEQRDVVFYVPFDLLVEKELVSEWRIHGVDIGDLFFWDGTWYQTWNVFRDHYFGQRSKAHYIACFANRYRHNSVPTNDVANESCAEEL